MSSGTASRIESLPSRRWTARDVAQMILFALLIKPFMTLFIGLRVRGREHLPEREQFILVANHSSHLDTASLLSLFRLTRLRRIRPVAAADYFERNAFVSVLTKTLFNILPIARRGITADNHPVERMRQAIAAGDSLILFPEGTRQAQPLPGAFKAGLYHLATRYPSVELVPVYLENLHRSLPKGTLLPVPLICTVRFGSALHVLPSEDKQAFLDRARGAVASLA